MRPSHTLIALLSAILIGCPLPFEFSGEGAGETARDPASPDVTAPVSIAYAESGGGSGTLANDATLVSGVDTTITLSTETPNAVIYYTTNGGLTDLNAATQINASSGSFVISRTTNLEQRTITAIAVGPNMRPSPEVAASIDISPFPILSVVGTPASISEDGGTGNFVISSNIPPDNDLAVGVTTGGDYTFDQVDLSGPAPDGWTRGGPGTDDTIIFPAGQTSISIPVTGKPTTANDSAEIELTINESTNDDYSVGNQEVSRIVIADNNTPILTFSVNKTQIDDDDTDTATFTVDASVAPTSDVILRFTTSGTYDDGDVNEIPGPAADSEETFTRTLPAGQREMSFAITATADLGDYGPETVVIRLLDDDAYELATNPSLHTITINDSSVIPTISIERSATVIDDDGQTATFEIIATPAPELPLNVNLQTGSAYQADDITGDVPGPNTGFQISIPASLTADSESVVLTFTTQRDFGVFDNETIAITVQSSTAYIGTPTAEIDINDTTTLPTLTIEADDSVIYDDGDPVTFTVTADPAPEDDVDIEFITDGHYQDGDLSGSPMTLPTSGETFSLQLAQGQQTLQFTVTPAPDADDIEDQTFSVEIVDTPTRYIRGTEYQESLTILDTTPSEYYVNADSAVGNDGNSGTVASDPFLTLQHALDVAILSGQTVNAAPGTYTVSADALRVAPGVTLIGHEDSKGDGATPTRIIGFGAGTDLDAAIEVGENATVAGFYINSESSSHRGVVVHQSGATVRNNTIAGSFDGLTLRSITSVAIDGILVDGNVIVGNHDFGLWISGNVSATVQNNTITGNDEGIVIIVEGNVDLGSAAGSAGRNTIAGNTAADLLVAESSGTVSARYNCWDNDPPSGNDIDSPAVTVDTTGNQLVGACQ